MKKGELLRLKIERLAPDGCGIAEINGRVIPVKGALPGDEVEVHVAGVKRRSARVKLVSILSEGIERITARCPHFSICGGCVWQNVPYKIQCDLKAQIIKKTFDSVPGIEPIDNIEFIPSPDVFYYRNKMEFTFDMPPKSENLFLGLHESGRFDKVFDVSDCFLQSEITNRLLKASRNFAKDNNLSVYGLKSHIGLLRFLVIRDAKTTGELMVNLVTSGEEFIKEKEFCDYIKSEIPEVTTFARSINRSFGSVSVGQEREILFGDGLIREKIGRYTFTISPDSFFQTNTHQTKNLYDTIREFSNLTGKENVLDLYSGTGTIGIYLAERAGKVTGLEMVEEAVRDAGENAEINEIDNISFVTGKAEKTIGENKNDFDVVICDPPRAGIHPKVMNYLIFKRIPRIVYVSCNVKAIPGDLDKLLLAGYRVKRVRAFDMSPHTPHIETVMLLETE